MSEIVAIDVAFYTGTALIGYALGGTLGAGIALVAVAVLFALVVA